MLREIIGHQQSDCTGYPPSLFAEFGPRLVMRQQRPLGCRGQPIRLCQADWFHPFASVRWRVDIGATGDQGHRHQECPDGQ